MSDEVLLLEGRGRSSREAHEPKSRVEFFEEWQVTVEPRDHVDFVAQARQLGRKFADVDIHAAGLAASKRRERAGVGREHGDAHGPAI